MTNSMQTVFDTATAGVIAQGVQSIGPDLNFGGTICLYRGKDGIKCAVGHVLSDEQMVKYAIGENMNPYLFPSELLNELLPGYDNNTQKTFLAQLQTAHDCSATNGFVADFTERANKVAAGYELNPIGFVKQEEP